MNELWEPNLPGLGRMPRWIAIVYAVASLLLLFSCGYAGIRFTGMIIRPITVDPAKARLPSFSPRPVPAAHGPVTIPVGLALPNEGNSSGTVWNAEARGGDAAEWPLDPCNRSLGRTPVRSDARSVGRVAPDGVGEGRHLALFADSAAATQLMADLRRSLVDCYASEASVWDSRDVSDLGDDAVEANKTSQHRDMALNVIQERFSCVVVQVRNAVFVAYARASDRTIPNEASLTHIASAAVDTLHRFGWPQ